jgi:hypothetical protein
MTRPLLRAPCSDRSPRAAGLTLSSTSTALIAAPVKVTNDTFDGITPPLTYTPGKPARAACSFVASVSDGKRAGRTA